MTGAELEVAVKAVVDAYEAHIKTLDAEIVTLKANQMPTGVVTLTITGLDHSQIKIT